MSLELKYFVLKPKSKFSDDPYALASRMAMIEYAKFILDKDPKLAKNLIDWVDRENFEVKRFIKNEPKY